MIELFIERMNETSSLDAGEQSNNSPGTLRLLFDMIVEPVAVFLRTYLFQGYFRRGIRGYIDSVLSSLSTLAVKAKLWEYSFRVKEGEHKLPPVSAPEVERLKRLF